MTNTTITVEFEKTEAAYIESLENVVEVRGNEITIEIDSWATRFDTIEAIEEAIEAREELLNAHSALITTENGPEFVVIEDIMNKIIRAEASTLELSEGYEV